MPFCNGCHAWLEDHEMPVGSRVCQHCLSHGEGLRHCESCHEVCVNADFKRSKLEQDGLARSCNRCLSSGSGTKFCPRCEQDLPASAFWKDAQKSDGLTASCGGCLTSAAPSSRPPVVRIEVPAGHKACVECGLVVPLEDFHVSSRSADGFSRACRACKPEAIRAPESEVPPHACAGCGLERSGSVFPPSFSRVGVEVEWFCYDCLSSGVGGKPCGTCLVVRPISEYVARSDMKDGRRTYCRDCGRQDKANRRTEAHAVGHVCYGCGEERSRRDFPSAFWTADASVAWFCFDCLGRGEGSKPCGVCGVVLPIDQFLGKTGTRDGRRTYCRPCHGVDADRPLILRSLGPPRVEPSTTHRCSACGDEKKFISFPSAFKDVGDGVDWFCFSCLELGVGHKPCGICGQILPIDQYAHRSDTSDGRRSYCQSCRRNGKSGTHTPKPPSVRSCSGCSQEKSTRDFPRRASDGSSGVNSYCFECLGVGLGAKTCGTCGVSKPIADFALSPKYRDGRRTDCVACKRTSDAERRKGIVEAVLLTGFKRCSGCGQVLPVEGFHESARAPDRRTSRCKSCYKSPPPVDVDTQRLLDAIGRRSVRFNERVSSVTPKVREEIDRNVKQQETVGHVVRITEDEHAKSVVAVGEHRRKHQMSQILYQSWVRRPDGTWEPDINAPALTTGSKSDTTTP